MQIPIMQRRPPKVLMWATNYSFTTFNKLVYDPTLVNEKLLSVSPSTFSDIAQLKGHRLARSSTQARVYLFTLLTAAMGVKAILHSTADLL